MAPDSKLFQGQLHALDAELMIGMPLGIPGNDIVSINHDSLWTGGPFSNTV